MNKLLIALAVGIAVTGSAHAQTTAPAPAPATSGTWLDRTYIGVGVAGSDNDTTDDWQAGAKIFGGYNIDRNWAVEAGYTRFGGKEFDLSTLPGYPKGNVKGANSYVAARYGIPLNDRVSAYGKLGVSYTERKTAMPYSSNLAHYDSGLYGAIGLQYALTPNVALVGEYERHGTTKEWGVKADSVSVGLKYGF